MLKNSGHSSPTNKENLLDTNEFLTGCVRFLRSIAISCRSFFVGQDLSWPIKSAVRAPGQVLAYIYVCCVLASACQAGKPNILFIAIDDLRPELGCYGSDIAISPNLDALAKDGLLFERAYCQQAICRPSRASLMTGARPETTGLFHNYVSLRELQPDILTLPQHFIANGYEAVYCGKVFHHGDTDEEKSWSREPRKEGRRHQEADRCIRAARELTRSRTRT